MARRKLEDKNTRKIFKCGKSYAATLPVELVKDLGWREKQKITVKRGKGCLIIRDWKNR